jgi:hypothetical protein
MKKLLLLFIFLSLGCFAQKSKKGGGGSAGTSAGASSSTQIQTGFCYRLRRGVFIKYIHKKMIEIPVTSSYGYTVTTGGTVSVTRGSLIQLPNKLLVLAQGDGNMTLEKGSFIQAPTGTKLFKKEQDSLDKKNGCVVKDSCGNKMITHRRKDSTIVTWVADTINVNYTRRLKISVAQDSGDLHLFIKNKGQKQVVFSAFAGVTTYTIYNPPPLTLIPLKRTGDSILGRQIDIDRDSMQNFHTIIPQSIFISDPTYFRRLFYNKVQYGVTSIPFQYRLGYSYGNILVPNSASASINGALYFGWEWGRTKFFQDPSKTFSGLSFVLAGFAGPTLIALSSSGGNVNAFSNFSNIPNIPAGGTNQMGISYGVSASINYQNLNIGLFVGRDSPLGADARTWYYANKTWIGFGVGFNLGMFVSGSVDATASSH